jgi:hypothetical protein
MTLSKYKSIYFKLLLTKINYTKINSIKINYTKINSIKINSSHRQTKYILNQLYLNGWIILVGDITKSISVFLTLYGNETKAMKQSE